MTKKYSYWHFCYSFIFTILCASTTIATSAEKEDMGFYTHTKPSAPPIMRTGRSIDLPTPDPFKFLVNVIRTSYNPDNQPFLETYQQIKKDRQTSEITSQSISDFFCYDLNTFRICVEWTYKNKFDELCKKVKEVLRADEATWKISYALKDWSFWHSIPQKPNEPLLVFFPPGESEGKFMVLKRDS